MIRQTEYASTTSTLVNCSNTYMYVQYHSLVLSENMCCSLHWHIMITTSSFILCSRLTIWWSRTTPCYYVQDVLLSILKCYCTTVTFLIGAGPPQYEADVVGDNSDEGDTCAHWVKWVILYIHVSVGTVYQCRGSACVLSLSNHHYHHDRRKNGYCKLVKIS